VPTPHQVRSVSEAFAALELPPTADVRAIGVAFKKRMKVVHPDRFGGDEVATKQVNAARELLVALAESGALAQLVEELSGLDELDFEEGPSAPARTPGGRETIPNFKKVAVLEYAGGGEYTLYLYGQFLRGNLSPLAAVRTLRRLIGPQFQGSLQDIRVWVFVPGVSMRQYAFPDLEEALESAMPPEAAPRTSKGSHPAPLQAPASGHRPGTELPSSDEEPPSGLEERFSAMDWTGLSLGYVILVEGGNVRVFRLKRVRGRVDVSYFGAYDSTSAALRDMNRRGLNPDIMPVWLLADVLGGEPTKLGAA